MNNAIQLHDFQGNDVRITDREGNPWFVARDVCNVLELDPTAVRRLDDDEKMNLRFPQLQTSGRGGDTGKRIIINESGLYSLILRSRKPQAKEFKRWITYQVLPAIRKTGGYFLGEEKMDESELLATALLIANRKAKEAESRALKAETKLIEMEDENEDLADQVAEKSEKETFFDNYISSEGLSNLTATAKLLGQPPHAFIAALRDNGFLCKNLKQVKVNGDWKARFENTPAQRFINAGYLIPKETEGRSQYGTMWYSKQTFVTPDGVEYLSGLIQAGKLQINGTV